MNKTIAGIILFSYFFMDNILKQNGILIPATIHGIIIFVLACVFSSELLKKNDENHAKPITKQAVRIQKNNKKKISKTNSIGLYLRLKELFLISYMANKYVIRISLLLGSAFLLYVIIDEADYFFHLSSWADNGARIILVMFIILFTPLFLAYLPIFLFVLPTNFFVNKGLKRLCLVLGILFMLSVAYINYEDYDGYHSFDWKGWLEQSWWQLIIADYVPSLIGYIGIWIYKGFKE